MENGYAGRLFPQEYYSCTVLPTLTENQKRNGWFCNRFFTDTQKIVDSSTNSSDNSLPLTQQNSSLIRTTSSTKKSRPTSQPLTTQESSLRNLLNDKVKEKNEIQDKTISTSDDSRIDITIPLEFSQLSDSDKESIADDQDADPDFNPSPNSSSSSFASQVDVDGDISSSPTPISINQMNQDEILSPLKEISDTTETISQNNKPQKVDKQKNECDFCFFCETAVTNFGRHIVRNHSQETEVQRILVLPLKSKKRKKFITLLRKKGNYLNNSTEQKPVRKNVGTKYLPCSYCFGFYSSKNLWRHRKYCSENPNIGESCAGSQISGQNLLTKHMKIDVSLRETVFPHMRADNISLTAKKDFLICAFGARYIKIHKEQHFINVASRKMREIARLLIEVKNTDARIKNLSDVLKPKYYDLLVSSTKSIAKYDLDKAHYKSPTLAINMGTTIKQCCEIALLFILKGNEPSVSRAESEVEVKTLIQLIEAHWRFDVSNQASNDLNIRKWNKVTIIPLANDLKIFKDYLLKLGNSAEADLRINKENVSAYKLLLESVYCRLILLNRKRPGELQRFLLHTYESNIQNDRPQHCEEFEEVITESEKVLMNFFKRIVIRGKRGRGVPVLFSKDLQIHINVLILHRQYVMKKPNLYLFGNPNTTETIMGYKVLQKHANLCGAKNPAAITCTKLRKHLGTLTQLINMSENDMEQLATFMGHTIGVHRSRYRLPDELYQKAKISKLLMMMEKGQAAQFKGKSLDEITLDLDEDLMLETETIQNEIYERKANIEENDDLISTEIENKESEKVKATEIIKRKPTKRVLVAWTEEQKNIVCSYFKDHIRNKMAPKQGEINILKEQYPTVLDNKSWLKIKVFIQNKYRNK